MGELCNVGARSTVDSLGTAVTVWNDLAPYTLYPLSPVPYPYPLKLGTP